MAFDLEQELIRSKKLWVHLKDISCILYSIFDCLLVYHEFRIIICVEFSKNDKFNLICCL